VLLYFLNARSARGGQAKQTQQEKKTKKDFICDYFRSGFVTTN
jgi:hypothetical protein